MHMAAMRTLYRAENNDISLDRSVFTRENFRRIGQFARPLRTQPIDMVLPLSNRTIHAALLLLSDPVRRMPAIS